MRLDALNRDRTYACLKLKIRASHAPLLAALLLLETVSPIPAAPITALVFSPDGSVLVSNGRPRKILLRSPTSGAVETELSCDLARITSLSFNPGGQFLVIGGGTPGLDGQVVIWSWPERRGLQRLTNFTDLVTSVAFSSAENLLVAGSADHSVRLWKLSGNGQEVVREFLLEGHAGPVLAVAFSPRAETVLSGSADRTIKVWSTDQGRLLRTLSQHTEAVHSLAFQPPPARDAKEPQLALCASGSDDRTVRIWQPEIGRMVRIIRKHDGPVLTLAFSPDARSLFSAGQEGIVRRLDPGSDAVLGTCCAHSDWIYTLAVSPDGSKLATGDWAGNARVWPRNQWAPD